MPQRYANDKRQHDRTGCLDPAINVTFLDRRHVAPENGGMHMPINLQDNEIMLRCACFAHEHTAMLTHEPDESRDCKLKGESDDWYLSVSLANHRFGRRVKKALQYVFRPSTIRYGMYAEIVLRDEDVERVVEFIRKRRATRTAA